MRATVLALLGAAVVAPTAQADGLTPVVQAAGTTATQTAKTVTAAPTQTAKTVTAAPAQTTNAVTAAPSQATKTPTALVAKTVESTPVAQPATAATTTVSNAADSAGGSVQQVVEKTTAVASTAVAPVAEVVQNTVGPTDSVVQPVKDTVRDGASTVTKTAAAVTARAGTSTAAPNASGPRSPAAALGSPPAGERAVGTAHPVKPERATDATDQTSMAPSSEPDSTVARTDGRWGTAVPSTTDAQTPAIRDVVAPVRRVIQVVGAPIATVARPAAAPLMLAVDVVTVAARDGARAVAARLPGQPRMPFGTPGAPMLSGAPAGGISTSLLLFATLLAPFVLAAPRRGRRLRPASDLMRPPAFVSLLERPG